MFWFAAAAVLRAEPTWAPIAPEEIAQNQPKVESDADAEILSWEIAMAENLAGGDTATITDHYFRIKIFTKRGEQEVGNVRLPYTDEKTITNIEGRTITPDGTIVPLNKTQIFDSEIEKRYEQTVRAKTFAMPQVSVGSIIEYRYQEIVGRVYGYKILTLQHTLPAQKIVYRLEPTQSFPEEGNWRIRMLGFKTKEGVVKGADNSYTKTVLNVPGLRKEPDMPADLDVKVWMLAYYSRADLTNPDKYWEDFGRKLHAQQKTQAKIDEVIRKKAAELVAGVDPEREKVRKLFDFCHAITNIANAPSGISRTDRRKFADQSPSQVIKSGQAFGPDINYLFIALCNAAGLDARLAAMPDKGRKIFKREHTDGFFLQARAVAVKIAGNWSYFDPAATYLPFNCVRWQEEGGLAVIASPKELIMVPTPASKAEDSCEKRNARLRLDAEGNLEGIVRVELTRHRAAELRAKLIRAAPDERTEIIKKVVQQRMAAAEVTQVGISNLTDASKPLVYSYSIAVAGYAEKNNDRLFFKPAFFVHGLPPRYTSSERRHPLVYQYFWTEQDAVSFEFPEGYALHQPELPKSIPGDIIRYIPGLRIVKDNLMVYEREFMLALPGVPAATYSDMKKVFDHIHTFDNHTLIVKKNEAAAPVVSPGT